MKKVLFSVLAVVILLAACGAPRSSISKRIWTYEDMVVGLLQVGFNSGDWRAANAASFRDTAKKLGITLKYHEAQAAVASQEYGFRQFIQDPEINVIVLVATTSTGWEDELMAARAAGKIVILEDRPIDASEDLYVTLIGPDFVEEGHRAAEEMCKLLEGIPEKNVWELVGDTNSQAAIDRGRGFHEKMGECGIRIIRSQVTYWDTRESKAVTEAWLKESQDVRGIFAQNDDIALGAIEALKAAGLKPGVDIKIVSIDGTAGAFQAMLAGELNVTVECNPLTAPQVYEAALKALNGQSVPKWISTNESVFRFDMPNLQEIANSRKY